MEDRDVRNGCGLWCSLTGNGNPGHPLQGPDHVPQAAAPAGVLDLAAAGPGHDRRLDGPQGGGAARPGQLLLEALDGVLEAVADRVRGVRGLDADPDLRSAQVKVCAWSEA